MSDILIVNKRKEIFSRLAEILSAFTIHEARDTAQTLEAFLRASIRIVLVNADHSEDFLNHIWARSGNELTARKIVVLVFSEFNAMSLRCFQVGFAEKTVEVRHENLCAFLDSYITG